MLLSLLFVFSISGSASAIVLEPTFQAAEHMGYQVLGELEFARGRSEFHFEKVRPSLIELGEVCPRTQAYDRRIHSETRFILLAWADREYPSAQIDNYSSVEMTLAKRRAQKVAQTLRKEVPGLLKFELVNMASRQPHLVKVVENARASIPRIDVKEVLRTAGAAPSDQYQLGLFGEFSQRSKVVIWVDCTESFSQQRKQLPTKIHLAQLGQIAR